jgi:hypothetical protein
MRFPPRMRRAIAAALDAAGAAGCDELAIEHLAATILRDRQSAGVFIIESAGISPDDLLKRVEKIQPTGPAQLQRAGCLSPATLRVLQTAADVADHWKHEHVGTEHFTLALLSTNSNPVSDLFKNAGLTGPSAEAGLRRWIAEKMPRDRRARHRPIIKHISKLRKILGSPVFAWKIFIQKSLAHPGFVRNPYPLYEQLREKYPVRRDPLAPVWVISRHADVQMMLKDQRFLKDPFAVARMPMEIRQQLGITTDLAPTTDVQVISMLFLDPPQHTRVRALFSRAFTPKMIAGLRPRIQKIMDERLAPHLSRGQMELIEAVAYPLPVIVIAELLGFPPEDYPLYKKWSDDFTAALSINPTPAEQERATQSREELRAYFDNLIEKNPGLAPALGPGSGPNLITALLAMENEPGALSRDELFINAALLLAAGHETTTNLISNGMIALLKNPDQLQRLRDNPSLIESCVEELLRFDSPVQWASRVVAEEVEMNGVKLEPGAILLASVGAANHDPRQFENPDKLDIARSDNRHLSFGMGIHFCLGAALARMEAQIAVQTLVQRLPNLRLNQKKVRWKKGMIFRAAHEVQLRFDPVNA